MELVFRIALTFLLVQILIVMMLMAAAVYFTREDVSLRARRRGSGLKSSWVHARLLHSRGWRSIARRIQSLRTHGAQ